MTKPVHSVSCMFKCEIETVYLLEHLKQLTESKTSSYTMYIMMYMW